MVCWWRPMDAYARSSEPTTRAPDTRTDRSGRYTITFPGGEGDYFMGFTAIGFGPRRFEIKRTADQEILVADARMQRAAAR